MLKGDNNTKLELEELIKVNLMNKVIDDNIVMSEVEESNENAWVFSLMSEYLKSIKTEGIEGRLNCELKFLNKEVHIFYENLIEKWFEETLTNQIDQEMLSTLIGGYVENFECILEEFVINNISYFNISCKEPKRVYHEFVLGMLISLSKTYEVKSNKESGYGRYAHVKKCNSTTKDLNIMIINKEISKVGLLNLKR